MRALALDFRLKQGRSPWGGVVLLALALATAGGLGSYYRQIAEQVEAAEGQVREAGRAAQNRAPASQRGSADPRGVAAEVRRANEVMTQLNLPWDELFKALESGTRGEVALLGIEPDPQKRRVRLTAEAKSLAAMLAYVRQLYQQGSLGEIFLQSHQVQLQAPNQPVRFTLTATWMAGR